MVFMWFDFLWNKNRIATNDEKLYCTELLKLMDELYYFSGIFTSSVKIRI
jgi:hypothetical protein